MLERFLSAGSYMNYAHFNGRQYSHKKKQQDVHNDYMYNDQTIFFLSILFSINSNVKRS